MYDAADFFNETNQPDKVVEPKMSSPRRNSHERVRRPNVRPIQRYGGFTALGVEKENPTLARNSPGANNFKLYIFVWMKRVDDSESFVVKILEGCSCIGWLSKGLNVGE